MNIQLFRIVRFTATALKVEVDDILSERRRARIVQARQLIMWLARQLTDLSSTEIGGDLHRDHSTVLHGVERTVRRRAENPTWRAISDELLARLKVHASPLQDVA